MGIVSSRVYDLCFYLRSKEKYIRPRYCSRKEIRDEAFFKVKVYWFNKETIDVLIKRIKKFPLMDGYKNKICAFLKYTAKKELYDIDSLRFMKNKTTILEIRREYGKERS